MKKMKNLMILIVGALVACSLSCLGDDEGDGSLVKVGDEVPDFTVSNGTGSVGKADMAGKRTLLVLFSTACGDCRRTLPVIDTAWLTLKNETDVAVITISREEPAATVATYWEENHFTMPYYLDEDRSVFKKFASAYTPRVYLVNKQQKIVEMFVEEMALTSQELTRRVLAL